MNYSPSHCTSDHILVIDDDSKLRRLLQKFLREKGFIVSIASSAQEAMKLQESLEFDVLVLDIMMPELNGFEYLRLLRKESTLPVILLSARGEAQDRIEGLEIGADDYLPKPFEPLELVARLRSVLRRKGTPAPVRDKLRFGGFEFDLKRAELWREGQLIHLVQAEAQLLKQLAEKAGEIVHRDALSENSTKDPLNRSVDVQIVRLRRKIEEDTKHPRYLQTVRGKGYRLITDA